METEPTASLRVDTATILQEHVLLDGGLVVELSVRLSDGRTGRVAVGERVIDGKKREMWAHRPLERP